MMNLTNLFAFLFVILLISSPVLLLTQKAVVSPPRASSSSSSSSDRELQSSTVTYVADAYECDASLNKIASSSSGESPPKQAGDSIRICVEPDRYTSDRGVLIRRINIFTFIKNNGVIQESIIPNGRESQDTLVTCESGEKLCVFTTKLHDDLFTSSGNVTGIGEVHMEFQDGADGNDPLGIDDRRRSVRRRRRLQQQSDVKFAGVWEVEVPFKVVKSVAPKRGANRQSPYEWWGDTDTALKASTIGGAIIVLLSLICCLVYCCLILYKRERDDADLETGKHVVPTDIDIDSQASFFKNFHKDFGSTKPDDDNSESEEDNEYVVGNNNNNNNDNNNNSWNPNTGPRRKSRGGPSPNRPPPPCNPNNDRPPITICLQNNAPPSSQSDYNDTPPKRRQSNTPKKPKRNQSISSADEDDDYDDEYYEPLNLKKPTAKKAKVKGVNKKKKKELLATEQDKSSIPPKAKPSPVAKANKLNSKAKTPKQKPVPKKIKKKPIAKPPEPDEEEEEDNSGDMSTSEDTVESTETKSETAPKSPREEAAALYSSADLSLDSGISLVSSNSVGDVDDNFSKEDKEDDADDAADDDDDDDDAGATSTVEPKSYSQNNRASVASSSAPSHLASQVNTDEWPSEDELSRDGSLDRHRKGSTPSMMNASDSDLDEDSVNFYPDEFNVAFGVPNHVGTMILDIAVRHAVSSHKGAKFSDGILSDIQKQLKGRSYYLKESAGRFEFWRGATPDEAKEEIEKVYKEQLVETDTVRKLTTTGPSRQKRPIQYRQKK